MIIINSIISSNIKKITWGFFFSNSNKNPFNDYYK